MSEQPPKPSLFQLWMTNPQAFMAEAGRLQRAMSEWWTEQFVSPATIMDKPLSDAEMLLMETLFVSAIGLPSAAVCMGHAHGLDINDPKSMPMLVRMAIFYGLLVGKGYLIVKEPPALPADFLQMMEIWQKEQQLKLQEAGNQLKVLQ